MSGHVRVVLLRHGQTEWSRAGRHTGRSDVPLDEGGRRDARTAGAAVGGVAFTRVLVSPLLRARETAELAGLRGPVELCDDLMEWDYGEYEGRTTAQIRADRPGWTIWNGDPPGGETADEVATRVAPVIARCRAAPGDALVFAHGHVLRVLTAVDLGFEPRSGAQFALDTATINVLGHEHTDPTLRRWNS